MDCVDSQNIMSMAESKVTGIVKSLNMLEDDLDSLNSKVSDMKKQLSIKAQTEIDTLLEKTREMATKEAEIAINAQKKRLLQNLQRSLRKENQNSLKYNLRSMPILMKQ